MATDAQTTIELRAADVTDVGMVRDHNEDSGYVDPELRFFIVADGMGGHAAGEIASAMAVEEVTKALAAADAKLKAFAAAPSDDERREIVGVLENAVRAAHQAVYARGSKESDKQGMGTTLDVLMVTGAEAFIAHVGDSRTYLLRDGKASQITTDHTVAEVLVIEGKLSEEEAKTSPLRTILVNAIGVSADVGVEISHVRLRKGDRLLLCSDGLHDYFPADTEIADHLLEGQLQESLAEMVEIAKQRGGHDNITGIVVEVLNVVAPTEDDDFSDDQQRSVSDGVPREIGGAETRPVDVEGAAEPESEDAPTAEQASAPPTARKRERGRSTLPMGVEIIDAKPAANRAIPSQDDLDELASRVTEPIDANDPDDDGEQTATRKTEPMQTVAQTDDGRDDD